jgi:DNA-binding transcriptional regulator YiaG
LSQDDDIDLKQARKDLGGISQQRLADLIGCSVYTVAAYEQGRSTPPTPIVRLIRRLVAEHQRVAA